MLKYKKQTKVNLGRQKNTSKPKNFMLQWIITVVHLKLINKMFLFDDRFRSR